MSDRIKSLMDEAARLRALAGPSDADIAAKLLALANEVEALAEELQGATDGGSRSTQSGAAGISTNFVRQHLGNTRRTLFCLWRRSVDAGGPYLSRFRQMGTFSVSIEAEKLQTE